MPKDLSKPSAAAVARLRFDPDPATIRDVVNRRTAMRWGLSLPVAAVVTALAGIGPREGRASR